MRRLGSEVAPLTDGNSLANPRTSRLVSVWDPSNQESISTIPSGHGNITEKQRPLPGRPKRRRDLALTRRKSRSFWTRLYTRWIQGIVTSFSSLFLALVLWYSLGVVSIGSSKLLLSQHERMLVGNIPPLLLTLQQLLVGSTLLRFLLQIRFLDSVGLQPWPSTSVDSVSLTSRRLQKLSTLSSERKDSFVSGLLFCQPSLLLAGVYFCLGFLATNYGFSCSSPAFVETIKAAEPITSASVAVWWGIEVLSRPERSSLAAIVAGVLLSTYGNHRGGPASSLIESFASFVVVMASNLCFSFRGLHQKLFRATPEGNQQLVDDLNLQFRMQQIGVLILAIPAFVWEGPSTLSNLWTLSTTKGLITNGCLVQYIGLALLNGCAFASYNLASTYILSRISVVHHAALNCLRRVFAVVVTSLLFQIPISLLGAIGIAVSVLGFMSFTHYKAQRQRQPKPLSSLLPTSAVN